MTLQYGKNEKIMKSILINLTRIALMTTIRARYYYHYLCNGGERVGLQYEKRFYE